MRLRQTRQMWQRRRVAQRGPLPLLPLLPLLVACGGGSKAAVAAKPTMHDSAGVTIVENTTPVWHDGGGWTLAPRPTASIGVLDGAPDYQLFRVRGAVRLSSGTIVIANSGTNQVRFYDSTGHFLKSVGREGAGPGEFKQLGSLFRFPGDTVGAFDWSLQRMSLFTPDGIFVRSYALRAPGGAGFLNPLATFSDGTLLVQSYAFNRSRPKTGVHRDSITYVRADPAGTKVDTVGTFIGDQSLVVAETNFITMTSLAFGRQSFIVTHDTSLVFGTNDRYAFEWLDRHGHVRRIVRNAHTPVSVTGHDIAQYKAHDLAQATTDNDSTFEKKVLDKMPWPNTFPAYQELKVDAAGDVWVKRYAAPGDSTNVWTVFGPDGWKLGGVSLPYNYEPNQIGRHYILGTWKDADDVEHVMEYGIRKPEAPPKEGS